MSALIEALVAMCGGAFLMWRRVETAKGIRDWFFANKQDFRVEVLARAYFVGGLILVLLSFIRVALALKAPAG